MEDVGVSFTTTTSLPNSLRHPQHCYPTSDVHVAHPEAVTSARVSYGNPVEEDPNPHPEFRVSIHENLTNGDEEIQLSANYGPRLHDTNVAANLLRIYLIVWAVVCVRLSWGNPMPFLIANPFMIVSSVALGLAYLIISILSWMYEHSDPSRTYYKILKGAYYILCNIAFFTLFMALFN